MRKIYTFPSPSSAGAPVGRAVYADHLFANRSEVCAFAVRARWAVQEKGLARAFLEVSVRPDVQPAGCFPRLRFGREMQKRLKDTKLLPAAQSAPLADAPCARASAAKVCCSIFFAPKLSAPLSARRNGMSRVRGAKVHQEGMPPSGWECKRNLVRY